MDDLTFAGEQGVLNIRVAAIIEDNGRFLISQWDDGKESLVGGRVKLGESTEQALIREILEETGMRVQQATLRAVVENFFVADSFKVHELLFIYSVDATGSLDEGAIDFESQQITWISEEELHRLTPRVIAQITQSEQQGVLHYLSRYWKQDHQE
jgi:8-oxo-dGTP pyrophosphatase MutT (NUDIX family)